MIPDASVLLPNLRGWRHVVAAGLVAVSCYLPAVRDSRTLVALTRPRGVTHVVLGPVELLAFDRGGAFSAVEERSRQGRFAFFVVRLAEPGPHAGRVE
jgi:hypothetical protein